MKQPSASIKMLRGHRCKIDSIEHKRWAGYATAALASGFTFSLAESAEAEIHYSGPINQEVPSGWCYFTSWYYTPGSCQGDGFVLPLGNVGFIWVYHQIFTSCYARCYPYGGSAFLGISAPGAAVRGVGASVSRLLPGDLISAGQFGGGYVLASSLRQSGQGGQFQAPGPAAVGFKFNTGAGEQYGWVRVRMGGFPGNTFGVVDYAVGDPGEVVKAGQKRSHTPTPTPTPTSTPRHSPADLESLGGLALGAAGLLAWRRRRANKRAAA